MPGTDRSDHSISVVFLLFHSPSIFLNYERRAGVAMIGLGVFPLFPFPFPAVFLNYEWRAGVTMIDLGFPFSFSFCIIR